MRVFRLAPLVPFDEAVTDVPPEDFVEVEGRRVYVRDRSSGPAIVLLHGFASTTHSFREIFDGMSGEFRLLGIDLNGFGNTERPLDARGYRIEEQARTVRAVLEAKGIERAAVVGHSYGAAVAAVLCERYPELFSRSVLISPPSSFKTRPPWYLCNKAGVWFAYGMIRLLLSSPEKFRKFSYRAVHVEGVFPPELTEIYRNSMRVEGLRQAFFGYLESFADGAGARICYHAITQPTLVIAGDRDEVVPMESCREVAVEIPTVELAILEACGHCPPEEQPREVIGLIRDFLTKP